MYVVACSCRVLTMRMPGSSRIAATIPYICIPGMPNTTSTPSPTSDLARASPPLIWTMISLLHRDGLGSPSPAAGSGAAYLRALPHGWDEGHLVAETRPIPHQVESNGVRCTNLSHNGAKVVGHQWQSTGMAMPLARQDYKPSTTTMLMLEDLERMSSSAVYSGEFSQV